MKAVFKKVKDTWNSRNRWPGANGNSWII